MLKFQALWFIKICSCFNMQAWATCIKVCFNSNILVFVDEMLCFFIKYGSVSWNTLMGRTKSELGFPFGIGFKPWELVWVMCEILKVWLKKVGVLTLTLLWWGYIYIYIYIYIFRLVLQCYCFSCLKQQLLV
jgi:hypothetical protein